MKSIVRYLLEGDGSVPLFIEDGGYFPSGDEYVGLSVDEDKRHLPATVYKLSAADLKARLLSIGCKDQEGNLLSDQECEDLANAFFSSKGL